MSGRQRGFMTPRCVGAYPATRRRFPGVLLCITMPIMAACSGGDGVTAAVPDAVEVLAPSSSLPVGSTQQLTARILARGAQLPGAIPAWSSSDGTIASVTASGQVTALARGTATITAAAGSARGSVALSILGVRAVLLQPAALTLDAGASQALTATVDADPGVSAPAVTWSSAAPAIATVSAAGVVTGVAAGTTTITATSQGKSASASVTVRAVVPFSTLSITPASLSLAIGAAGQLTAAARDSVGTLLVSPAITWTSAAPTVASVSTSGVVTGVAAGRTTIMASGGTKSASASVLVVGPTALVTITPVTDSLVVGQRLLLSASATDALGTVLSDRQVSWQTSNPAVATVAANGEVTGITVGTVGITATIDGKSATRLMRVLPAASRVVQLSSGGPYSCAQKSDGAVYCWGNIAGIGFKPTPFRMDVSEPWVDYTSGYAHFCWISATRDAYCIGNNMFGQLGNGAAVNVTERSPQLVRGGLKWSRLVSNIYSTCGTTHPDLVLYCWGGVGGSGMEQSPATESLVPVRVANVPPLRRLTSGISHVCGMASGGQWYCAGMVGDNVKWNPPRLVLTDSLAQVVAVAAERTCTITAARALWCFGRNVVGELSGTPASTDAIPPEFARRIAPQIQWTSMASGFGDHLCGIDIENRGYCWGRNVAGQVGDGTTANRALPTQLTGTWRILAPSLGGWGIGNGDHTCGLSISDEVFCWGFGDWGPGGVILTPTKVVIP